MYKSPPKYWSNTPKQESFTSQINIKANVLLRMRIKWKMVMDKNFIRYTKTKNTRI